MSRHLVEPATNLILSHIQSNIAAALAGVRSDRNSVKNKGLPTPIPQEYFIAKNISALKPPSVFIVCETIDFKKDRGANFITATAEYEIAAISEAQTTEDVTRITWRYQAALSGILDNTSLTAADCTFKITIIVRGADFSEEYDPSSKEGNPAKIWRKGVRLRCDVEFYEAL